ncbi:MAG: PQQ-dependent sugar dehydrogenase [Casimicrobiaceae bacterium]|nr:PQQ-dependent sugar dehydrogenase [Casimicrobiaceae bacterium]MDW8312740.1 PQQ-dependent sugar dehydrogenase [Burkholderiales bacterium]
MYRLLEFKGYIEGNVLRSRSGSVVLFAALMAFALAGSATAQIVLKPAATGLTQPVDLAHAGDERLFVVEQPGRIRIVNPDGQVLTTPFLDITDRVLCCGERGLLGLAFHPNYASNGRFFVYYTSKPNGELVIARFERNSANPNTADPNSEKRLLEIPHPTYANHNGGGLRFGLDGYLYIATGDSGGAGDPLCKSQDASSLLGKILRLDVNVDSPPYYAIPVNNPTPPAGGRPEILALGLRNPWRISFDRITGDLYIGDVGQNAREEVNRVTAAELASTLAAPINFGWPQREGTAPYGTSCAASGLPARDPIAEYDHNAGDCSITSGYRYRGTLVAEFAAAPHLLGDFCTGRIWTASPAATGLWPLTQVATAPSYQLSSFGEDVLGELYVAYLGAGEVRRIASSNTPVLDIDGNGSASAATDGLLLARYLFGLRGTALTQGALGLGATRDAAAIETYLAAAISGPSPAFKLADGSEVKATTDGLLVLRYLLGLRGEALTAGIPLAAPLDTPGKVALRLSWLLP